MKKYLLLPLLALLVLTYGALPAKAADRDAILQNCLKQQGMTSTQFYSPKTQVEGNPVEFFEKYIGVMDCFVGSNGREANGPGYMMIPYATKIKSFANSIGFDFVGYRNPMNADCQKKDAACTKAHWDDGYDCSANVWYPCLTESEIATENAMVSAIRKYALSLPMPHKEPEEPICGPFEYLVGGRCQHIFELCGRDSLFQYNEATGVCSCPDPYIPSDGKCVHEDDLNPPDLIHIPPPGDEPPPPPSPKPPVIYTPPEDDFPPDDPRNAFCQPPEGAVAQANEYGIPIANAQIYSNYSVVTHLEGEVWIMTKNAPQWAPAFKGQRMTIGDKIKTTKNGRCEVTFANSAVFRMRPLSQLEIPDHKNGCSCHLNHRVGYLDMKFGKVWSKVKPTDDECDWWVKTPTAIAGGSDRGYGDLPRNYVSYPKPEESTWNKLKNVWSDIINNLSSDDTPSNSPENYRQPQSFRESGMSEVALNVIDIQKALAEDGGEIILHASYDEATQISKFYVEEGSVDISDIGETVSVPLSAGEQITVEPDALPHDMDIEPVAQVAGQWWEEWDEQSGFSVYVPLIVFVAGIVTTIIVICRSKKRGFLRKIGIAVLGFILAFIVTMFVS